MKHLHADPQSSRHDQLLSKIDEQGPREIAHKGAVATERMSAIQKEDRDQADEPAQKRRDKIVPPQCEAERIDRKVCRCANYAKYAKAQHLTQRRIPPQHRD